MNAFLIVVLALAALAALFCLFVLVRLYYLGSRIGAFRTLLRIGEGAPWMRGYARYGRYNMAWSRLISLSIRPRYLFSRARLQLDGPPERDTRLGTVTLMLSYGETHIELVVSEGDYSGLVSWIDSLPPGELPPS